MKSIFKKSFSLVMALLMLGSLLGLFTLSSAAGEGYQTAVFDIVKTGTGTPDLHNTTLQIDLTSVESYSWSDHRDLLLALFMAGSKSQINIATGRLNNYVNGIANWLETVDTDAADQFTLMCSDIKSAALAYYDANRNLTNFTPSYTYSLSNIYWQRSLASDADLTNSVRDYFQMASGKTRRSYNASYINSNYFPDLKDLTKTTCIRAKLAFTITNSDHPAGVNYNAYSNEIRIGAHEFHAAVPETCTSAGIEEYYVCPVCGEKVSFYKNGTLNEATGNGVESTRLQLVTDDELVTEGALGHDYVPVVTPPTCEDGGFTTYTCSRCGDSYTGDETLPTGHTWDEGVVTPPTCTEGGYTTYTCTACQDTYTGNETPAAGHTWDEGEVITPATCAAEGQRRCTCTVCGDTETFVIPALPHTTNPEDPYVYAPDGSSRYRICSVCGGHGDEQFPTGLTLTLTQTCPYKLHASSIVLDHTFPRFDAQEYVSLHFDYREETDPTLKAEKLEKRNAYKAFFVNWFTAINKLVYINPVINYIENDGTTRAQAERNANVTYYYNVQFNLTGNVHKQLYVLDGSAEDPNYNYAETVSVLDFSIRPQNGDIDYDLVESITAGVRVISKYGSSTSGYIVTVGNQNFTKMTKCPQREAICGQPGYTQDLYYCSACEEYYSYFYPDGTANTVLCEDGVTRMKLMQVDVSDYQLDPPAEAHNMSVAVTKEPTCTEAGERTATCLNCGVVYTYTIDPLGHDLQEYDVTASCTVAGAHVCGCTRCDYIESYEETAPALGHSYTETVIAPTCTEGGCTMHVCSRCGDMYSDSYTPATGHTPDAAGWHYHTNIDQNNNSHPTRDRVCAVCGASYDEQTPDDVSIRWTRADTYDPGYHGFTVTQPMDFPSFDTAEYAALYKAYLALPEGEEKDAAYEQALGYSYYCRKFACIHNGYYNAFNAMVEAINADPDAAVANGWGATYYYDIFLDGSTTSLNSYDGVDDHSFTNVELFDFMILPRLQPYDFTSYIAYKSVLYCELRYGQSSSPTKLQINSSSSQHVQMEVVNEVAPTCTETGVYAYYHCTYKSCTHDYYTIYLDDGTINYVTCPDGVQRAKLFEIGDSRYHESASNIVPLLTIPAIGHTFGEEWHYDASDSLNPVRYHKCIRCDEREDVEGVTYPHISFNYTGNYPTFHSTTITQPTDFDRFDLETYVALYKAYLDAPEGDGKEALLADVNGYVAFYKKLTCPNGGTNGANFTAMIEAINNDPDHAAENGYGVITYYYDVIFGSSVTAGTSANTFDGAANHSFTNVGTFDFSVRPRATDYNFRSPGRVYSVLFAQFKYADGKTGTSEVCKYFESLTGMFLIDGVDPTCTEAGCAPCYLCGDCNKYYSFYANGTTVNTVVCADGVEREKLVFAGSTRAIAEAALTIPATGHVPGEEWIYNDGHTQRWHVCTECGEIIDLEDVQNVLVGDVNLDGHLGIEDVTALLNLLASSAERDEVNDVNGDGSLGIEDVTALLNILAGQ